jgi:PAS domain S-box-containing protein
MTSDHGQAQVQVQLDLLIDSVVDYAIFMLDPEGYVLSWNTGAERTKGYSRAEILGQHFSRFYTPEDQAAGLPRHALETARREGRFRAEGWRVRKDGSRFWASVMIDAIRNPVGELAGFAKVTRDFTERQATHSKLLESERRHRLLLEAVVDYAIFQLDIGGRIATWNAGAQRIKGYGADEAIWSIEADPNQLESALVNLAINARDAMPEGGKLTIEAANVFADNDYVRVNPEIDEGQYVAICVSDTGSGMSKEIASRAFEPFFTTKEAGHGTGLGLSQVYGFVKQSGGHVKIYSEPGHGTTVKMYFPRFVERTIEEEIVEATPVAEGDSETILVVEDDQDVRSYLLEMLRELKYRAIPASSAQAALHVLVEDDKQVNLLLTDVIMPGHNGRELGRRAQALRPGLPVLYMTGYSRNAVVHQGRLDEGVDLIQKPISQAQLATRIRQILDRKPVT